jgi:hypothetical protein
LVGLSPSRAAAPPVPWMVPPQARSARSMIARTSSSKRPGFRRAAQRHEALAAEPSPADAPSHP